jgi:hypothetical protein
MTENEGQGVGSGLERESLAAPQRGMDRRRYWKEHIERWRSSGMTQKDYCLGNGLKWSTFHYWRKRLHEPATPVSLIRVSLGPGTDSKDMQDWPGLVLFIGDRFKVQVGDEFNAATLARLVETLGQL